MAHAWLIVLIGLSIVVVVNLLVFLAPALGRKDSGSVAPGLAALLAAPSPTGALVVGFGHLAGCLVGLRPALTVSRRMARALDRIDRVDPYAAPLRIGVAMLEAGLVDAPAWPPPSGAGRSSLAASALDRPVEEPADRPGDLQ